MHRFIPFRSGMLIKASSVTLVSLLFASVSWAAPAPRPGAAGRVCDGSATTARKLLRHVKSFGGPLAQPSTRALAGLADPMALLKRAPVTSCDDDDDAIQNDAPAAQFDLDERHTPALRALGVLPRSHGPRLPTRAFTPRSPRGPPAAA